MKKPEPQVARWRTPAMICRHVYQPAETCGELLDAMANDPQPKVDLDLLDQIAKHRGRRSGGRK